MTDHLSDDYPEQKSPDSDSNFQDKSEKEAEIIHQYAKQTENMEVHHHAHHDHGKKNWKSYFWEFFMLFLAVFCGFLAELQLEHYIEHQREKKYITRIYRDIERDAEFYSRFESYLEGIYYTTDSLIQYLADDKYQKEPDTFYKLALRVRSTRYLEFYNTAYDQMKSSGNLRLIQSENVLDSLLNYYYVIEKRAMVSNNRHLEIVTEINNALSSVWDAGNFKADSLPNYGITPLAFFKASSASIPKVDPHYLLVLKNQCFQRKFFILSLRNMVFELQRHSANLIALMEQEYSISPIKKTK